MKIKRFHINDCCSKCGSLGLEITRIDSSEYDRDSQGDLTSYIDGVFKYANTSECLNKKCKNKVSLACGITELDLDYKIPRIKIRQNNGQYVLKIDTDKILKKYEGKELFDIIETIKQKREKYV